MPKNKQRKSSEIPKKSPKKCLQKKNFLHILQKILRQKKNFTPQHSRKRKKNHSRKKKKK